MELFKGQGLRLVQLFRPSAQQRPAAPGTEQELKKCLRSAESSIHPRIPSAQQERAHSRGCTRVASKRRSSLTSSACSFFSRSQDHLQRAYPEPSGGHRTGRALRQDRESPWCQGEDRARPLLSPSASATKAQTPGREGCDVKEAVWILEGSVRGVAGGRGGQSYLPEKQNVYLVCPRQSSTSLKTCHTHVIGDPRGLCTVCPT